MDEDRTHPRVAELSRESWQGDSAGAMAWGAVELEAELSEWLKRLPARHLAAVAIYIDLLARHGPHLPWPHVRQVDRKLRKLRFHLDGRAVRIIYWIAPGRRIVLLTVFMKARMREQREISRARSALKRRQVGAGPAVEAAVAGRAAEKAAVAGRAAEKAAVAGRAAELAVTTRTAGRTGKDIDLGMTEMGEVEMDD